MGRINSIVLYLLIGLIVQKIVRVVQKDSYDGKIIHRVFANICMMLVWPIYFFLFLID